jgi:hypothetical protein
MSLFPTTPFDKDSTFADLANNYCCLPIKVKSFSEYPELKDDEIARIKSIGGIDLDIFETVKSTVSSSIFNIDEDVKKFKALGGTLVIAKKEVQNGEAFKVHIRPNDLCLPICHEGMNRSQILHLVLRGTKNLITTQHNVTLPHGAESGFDPYQAFQQGTLNNENYFGYIHGKIVPFATKGDWFHKCFYQTFGVEKEKRIGYDICESEGRDLNPDDLYDFVKLAEMRTAQRKDMDKLMYDSDILNSYTGIDGRVIVFTFCRATGIFLHRLLEVSGDKDLSNIIIVCLPFPDVISRAGGMQERAEYETKTGRTITRNALNIHRHNEVFKLYASLIQPIHLE